MDRDYDAGSHSVVWDGLTSSRRPAPSGVYFYTITAGAFSDTRKMVRIQ